LLYNLQTDTGNNMLVFRYNDFGIMIAQV
jgi:hypothetical protein